FLAFEFFELLRVLGNQLPLENYSLTSMPMLRAVPLIERTADSRLMVLRSGSFSLAISSTCFSVNLPTLLRFGSGEPLTIPAARFSNSDAGGVFMMKVKLRSL